MCASTCGLFFRGHDINLGRVYGSTFFRLILLPSDVTAEAIIFHFLSLKYNR